MAVLITSALLRVVVPTLPQGRAEEFATALAAVAPAAEITTPARVAAFVAQLAHETGGFRWLHELWGPTTAQKRYEPPSTLAVQLGNTQVGDGFRYRGRGFIQLTGRHNYRLAGLEQEPSKAAEPATAARLAADYWTQRDLNTIADQQTYAAFVRLTKRVNGGTNGLAERVKYLARARHFLALADLKA